MGGKTTDYMGETWTNTLSEQSWSSTANPLFVCKKCTRVLDLGWNFCPQCGRDLKKKEPRKWVLMVYINNCSQPCVEGSTKGTDVYKALGPGAKIRVTLEDDQGSKETALATITKNDDTTLSYIIDTEHHMFCFMDVHRGRHLKQTIEEIL